MGEAAVDDWGSTPLFANWFDARKPHRPGVVDALLDGPFHSTVDRYHADRVAAVMPGLPGLLRGLRGAQDRMIADCARTGIRQYVYLGSAYPTTDTLPTVAERASGNRVSCAHFLTSRPVAVAVHRAVTGCTRAEAETVVVGEPRYDRRTRFSTKVFSSSDALLLGVRWESLMQANPRFKLDEPFGLVVGDAHRFPEPVSLLGHLIEGLAPGSVIMLSALTRHGLSTGKREELAAAENIMARWRAPTHHDTESLTAALRACEWEPVTDLSEPGIVALAFRKPLHASWTLHYTVYRPLFPKRLRGRARQRLARYFAHRWVHGEVPVDQLVTETGWPSPLIHRLIEHGITDPVRLPCAVPNPKGKR